jgi:hypothetical protein
MESKKILGIIRNNLDEIAQPISELILLLRSLSEEIEEKDKIYPSIKIMGTQLDNILDIIGYIYQRTWFNAEFMVHDQRQLFFPSPHRLELPDNASRRPTT